ncbi:unnamed protein product [Acanthoscelides obtectus]|uniref:C2H2-type domain-containing protein n=1 Tax=Acanthoscelides obtectus TaxID=200917 RepID=A0A9P0VUP7_ACAOB|nr:unnamed protein product [Acanthoscelides obtectus]CAK1684376.1 hypothetical protein AOBTE_LOCUS34840 [Acanthoscelides obtectus]
MSRWLIPGSNARTAPYKNSGARSTKAPVLGAGLTNNGPDLQLAQPASSKRGSEDKGRTDISKAKPVSGAKKCNTGAKSSPNYCTTCDTAFTSAVQLRTHKMARACEDRLQCRHCPMRFGSYKSTRQHERRAHPVEYAGEIEKMRGPLPEPEILQIMARIEAREPAGRVNKCMAEATDLTVDQVRFRRRKPEYQRYLELARKQFRASGTRILPAKSSSPAASTSGSSVVCQTPVPEGKDKLKQPASCENEPLSQDMESPLLQKVSARQKRMRESCSPHDLNPPRGRRLE